MTPNPAPATDTPTTGGTTGTTPADTQEQIIRSEGRWMRRIGTSLATTAIASAATYRATTGHEFPYEITLGVLFAAAIILIHGIREHDGRFARAAVRRSLAIQETACEQLQVLPGVLERLTAVEQTVAQVPSYAEGLLVGVELRQAVSPSNG